MSTPENLKAKQARVDPNRWKFLWVLIPTVLAIGLAYPEWLLVRSVLAGYTQDLLGAIFVGLMLLVNGYAASAGWWGWWHRAVGEDALMQAAHVVAQLPVDTPVIFRTEKPSPPHKVIYSALPVTFLGISVYCLMTGDRPMGFGMLVATGLFALVFWFSYSVGKRARPLILTFDATRKIVVFENGKFLTQFFPAPPRSREEIPFEEILACYFSPSEDRGQSRLRLKTVRGLTDVPGRISNFDAVRALFESIVTLNLADSEQHRIYLQRIPKIKVPWYGWLIIAAPIGAVVWLIWWMLFRMR